MNGGVCTMGVSYGTYACECAAGFLGANCQHELPPTPSASLAIIGNGQSSDLTECAANTALHEVRCCSDTVLQGYTQNNDCAVWAESQFLSVGPAGGGTIPFLGQVLSIAGLSLEDITPSFLAYGDGFSKLADGNVDAAFALSGYPAGAVMQARWAAAPSLAASRGDDGNRRLHHKWQHFTARKKRPTIANVAIARELAGWCWSLAVMPD